MIQLLMADLSITDDIVMQSFDLSSWSRNILDYNSIVHTSVPTIHLNALSSKRLKSDGLSGIVDGSTPVSGDVVVLQKINGLYVELGSAVTADGSWEINHLPERESIAIALKEGYNAGVVSGLLPKD